VVQRLDGPVPADPVGEAGGACLGGGEASDGVDGHGPPAAAAERPGPAGDPQRLGGVGEVEAGNGGDLQAAGLSCVGEPYPLRRGNVERPGGSILDIALRLSTAKRPTGCMPPGEG